MVDRIEDWFSFWRSIDVPSHEMVAFAHPAPSGDRTPPSGRKAGSPKPAAEVNAGRWIVRCPFCVGGAELANFETGLFFCCNCRNAQAENAYLHVKLPSQKVRGDVEKHLLSKRSRPEHRHWVDGETVEDLKKQDAQALALGFAEGVIL